MTKISKAEVAKVQKQAKAASILGYAAIPFLITGAVITNIFGSLIVIIGFASAVVALGLGIFVRHRIKKVTTKSVELERIRATATQGVWFGGGILIALGALALLGIVLSATASSF
jgi:uncharacterized membrane protein YphA (DoxX/SURF4 family)